MPCGVHGGHDVRLSLFSVLRRIYVDDAFGWGPARTTTICFAQCMPAADVVALLEKQQGINGYILYMDVAAHPLSGEQLFLHGVRGAVAEVCTPATALAGTLEGNDTDLFMLRSASHVPQAFLLAADDMVIQINDDNFACAGVQNGTWELSWSPMVPSPMAVSIQRAGSNRVFDESEWLNHGVIITAACAARHNYPVSALRITFWNPDAKGAFLTLLGHFGDNVAQYHMPWGTVSCCLPWRKCPWACGLNIARADCCGHHDDARAVLAGYIWICTAHMAAAGCFILCVSKWAFPSGNGHGAIGLSAGLGAVPVGIVVGGTEGADVSSAHKCNSAHCSAVCTGVRCMYRCT